MGLEGLLGRLQRLGPHRPRGAALPLLLLEGHLVRVRVRVRARARARARVRARVGVGVRLRVGVGLLRLRLTTRALASSRSRRALSVAPFCRPRASFTRFSLDSD